MKFAPETPTTEQLHKQFELTSEAESKIAHNRRLVSNALTGLGFIDTQGPCALTDGRELVEADLERMCAWKPRSNPESWHGMETTDPTGAFKRIDSQAKLKGNVAMEIGRLEHAIRYGSRLAFGWFGGRNDELEPKVQVALDQPSLPLGEKNPLSGEIESALETVVALRTARTEQDAPVVLIYRGGENAQDPAVWEKQYINAYNETNGRLIVDSAHGSEMAHDPNGEFTKSAHAQALCLEHIARLAVAGYAPAGVMAEASMLESPVDPPVSPTIARKYITIIRKARLEQIRPPRRGDFTRDQVPYFA